MKAITLHQPWASLIVEGVKKIETRSWLPPKQVLGKQIAIHAGRTIVTDLHPDTEKAIVWLYGPDWVHQVSTRAVVCLARVSSAGRVVANLENGNVLLEDGRKVPKDPHGDYRLGRALWFLSEVEPLKQPAPARGFQGFWEWRPQEGDLW